MRIDGRMSRVISIHEYILKPGIGAEQIENAVRIAEGRGLFRLPGLVAYHFGQGIRGVRRVTMWPSGSMRAGWLGRRCGAPWRIAERRRSIPQAGKGGRKNA